jgi:hypothetical protein
MRHPQRDDAHSHLQKMSIVITLLAIRIGIVSTISRPANQPVRSGGAHADGEPNEPFKILTRWGFVAILGVISLIGMVIPHSVMLMCWRRCSRSSSCQALNVAWFRIEPEHLDEEWCRPKPLRLRPREFQ